MEIQCVRSMFLLAALVAQLACASDGVGPGPLLVADPTEPLALTTRVRKPVYRERVPDLEVSSLAGSIRVEVARPDLACTIARGWVGREPGVLTVLARVGGDPSALCASGYVVEYAGIVDGLARGRYTVHVHEAVGGGAPRWLGTKTVTVP